MNLDDERSATLPDPVQRQLLYEWIGIQAVCAAHDDATTVIKLEQMLFALSRRDQLPQALADLRARGDDLIAGFGRFRRRAEMVYHVLYIDRRIRLTETWIWPEAVLDLNFDTVIERRAKAATIPVPLFLLLRSLAEIVVGEQWALRRISESKREMRIDATQCSDTITLSATAPDIPRISRELLTIDFSNPALGGERDGFRRMVEIALTLCANADIEILFDVRRDETLRLSGAFLA